MAARVSRRGGTASSAPTPTISSPQPTSKGIRPPSPLSPARANRADEKRQMQNLNDRLAGYIDAVRNKELEVATLRNERTVIEETHINEVTKIKNMYAKEVNQLRKAVDAISGEKARLEIEARKFAVEAQEANMELAVKENKLAAAEKDLAVKNTRLSELEGMVAVLDEEVKTLRPIKDKLEKKLADAKRNLEDETLKRTECQNQLLSTRESLQFENQMLEQQVNESKIRKEVEISEMDGRLQEEYDRKLRDALEELRMSFDQQTKENRNEFSRLYDEKVNKLQKSLNEERSNKASVDQEVSELRKKITGLTTRNSELESASLNLQKRMSSLIADMEAKEAAYKEKLARKDAEIKSREEQMEDMLKDYRDLMEIKVALDVEIAAYRKLIEGEETRLGVSFDGGVASPTATPSGTRGLKRKRTSIYSGFHMEDELEKTTHHSGLGTVIIDPIEKGANWIRIVNKTNEDINIGGWSLVNITGFDETSYKFIRSASLAAGATCTVWSTESKEVHSPPVNLVMKKGSWMIGAENKTTLLDKNGVEVACRVSKEVIKRKESYESGNRMGLDDDAKSCVLM